MTYLSNPRMFERRNAEGVYHFQPRVARRSALPWGNQNKERPNPERVAERSTIERIRIFANSFRVHQVMPSHFPGRCPGLGFANAFGVSRKAHQRIRQIYHYRFNGFSVSFATQILILKRLSVLRRKNTPLKRLASLLVCLSPG
jgi:hypothetical protein